MRLKFVMLSALMGSLALLLGSAPGHTPFAGGQRVHPPAGNLLGTGPAKHEQLARADNFDAPEGEPVVPQSWMDERFRRLDKDGDGYLSYDEMTENLKAERDLWDHNKDGKIDLEEWREYVEAFIAHQRRAGIDQGDSAWPRDAREPVQGPAARAPGQGQRGHGKSILQALKARAEARPRAEQPKQRTAPRPAKPVSKLPPGFKEYDTDGDGQIALHEWKARNGTVEEFQQYDLDGDGFITVEELIRAGRMAAKSGFLPQEFRRFDIDGDGQIALYEWKDKNGSVEDFLKYDLDGDGFLTPKELGLAGRAPNPGNMPPGQNLAPGTPPQFPGQLRGQNGKTYYVEVTGTNAGSVWGTDIYTDDSSIAMAAVHAGLLRNGQTGVVMVTILPPQEQYIGSTRNGVTTGSFGGFGGSYRLDPAPRMPRTSPRTTPRTTPRRPGR